MDETKKGTEPIVRFYYKKENNYRTYHVDGVFGGMTPDGRNIFMDVYSERFPTPQTTEHKLLADGNISLPTNVVKKEGIIRDIECGLMLNIEVARKLRNWLSTKIETAEKASSPPKKQD